MKSFGILSVVAMVMSGWITSYSQEIESEVPGDNFSLEGALELFKKSASPEEFEKMLNSADSKVNNLDLNGDGYIDYIKVLDRYEGNVHAFVIQAVVSETENQDVAVIELEKLANGKAVLQIVGNEDVYGIETIIEPTQEVRTYAGTTSSRTVVNVWAWPSVQYVYGPRYTVWMSPWGWYHRPVWWHTWSPVAYVYYRPIWRPYRPYYAVCHTRRVVYADRIYRPYRTTSVVVRNRHHEQIAHYRSERRDDYRNERARNDERRSYDRSRSSTPNAPQQRREDFDRNRRSSTQREVLPSSNLSTSRERGAPADIRRNATVQKGNDSQDRSAGTVDNNREVRKQATTTPPAMNRSRSSENPAVQQRRATSERSVPNNNIQRNTTVQKRDASPARSGAVQNKRETRQPATSPAVNRSRSTGSPAVQKRSSSGNRSSGTRSAGETKRGRD